MVLPLPTWVELGAFYPVLGARELTAELGYTTHHRFIPQSHILGAQGVVVGEEYVLAVHAGRAAYGLGIDGQPAPWTPAEIAAVALGGHQLTGALGRVGSLGIQASEFLTQGRQHRLTVLALARG